MHISSGELSDLHYSTLLRDFSSFDIMLLHLKLLTGFFYLTLYNNYASRVLNQNNNIILLYKKSARNSCTICTGIVELIIYYR